MAQDYKVLGQKQVMNLNPAGTGFSNDWEITYQVTDGPSKNTVSTVTVQASDHNDTYVDRAIREQIDRLHGVASLGYSD